MGGSGGGGVLSQFIRHDVSWSIVICIYDEMRGSWRFSIFVASNSAGKGDICWEESSSLGMRCAKVGVFQKVDHCCFTSLLEGEEGWCLETMNNLSWRLISESSKGLENVSDWVKINIPLRWNGAFWMRRSVERWYLFISLRATVPGLQRCLRTPVVTGAVLRAIFWEWRFFLEGFSELFFATAFERGIYK